MEDLLLEYPRHFHRKRQENGSGDEAPSPRGQEGCRSSYAAQSALIFFNQGVPSDMRLYFSGDSFANLCRVAAGQAPGSVVAE